MGKEFLHTIDIVKFRNAFPVSDTVGIGDDFFVLDMRYDSCLDVLMHPCRLDAYLAFFCIGGSLKFSINLREFEVGENTLAVNIPGNILQVTRLDETGKDNLHFVVAAMSREYVSRMHIDVGRLFSEGMTLLDNPAVTLTAEERKIAGNYFDLVHNVLTSPLLYKRECVSSLVSSVFYLVAGVLSRNIRLSAAVSAGTGNGTTGARAVFDSFHQGSHGVPYEGEDHSLLCRAAPHDSQVPVPDSHGCQRKDGFGMDRLLCDNGSEEYVEAFRHEYKGNSRCPELYRTVCLLQIFHEENGTDSRAVQEK